jgi:hypothetical protein
MKIGECETGVNRRRAQFNSFLQRSTRLVLLVLRELYDCEVGVRRTAAWIEADGVLHLFYRTIQIAKAHQRLANEYLGLDTPWIKLQSLGSPCLCILKAPRLQQICCGFQLDAGIAGQQIRRPNIFAERPVCITAPFVRFGQLHPRRPEFRVLLNGVAELDNGLVVLPFAEKLVAALEVLLLGNFWVLGAGRHQECADEDVTDKDGS